MFYCKPCQVEKDWPVGWMVSYGKCECCGTAAACYDVPSRYLD